MLVNNVVMNKLHGCVTALCSVQHKHTKMPIFYNVQHYPDEKGVEVRLFYSLGGGMV